MSTVSLAAKPPKRRVRYGAAALSLLFPGVGQVYAGFASRGFAFATAALVWTLLFHALPYLPALASAAATAAVVLVLLPTGLVLALVAAGDAFLVGRRGGGARLERRQRWLLALAFIAVPALPGFAARLDWAHYEVPTGSMVPTVLPGDRVLAVADYYRAFVPARGDLVAFEARGTLYVKRIVGLPGDRIAMRGGALLVNGRAAMLEPLAPDTRLATTCSPGAYPRYRETLPGGRGHQLIEGCGPGLYRDVAPAVVPPGRYFMMGDNRDDSEDSRDAAGEVGLVPRTDFVARVVFVTYSLGPGGWHGWRWWRTGRPLE